MAAAGLPLPTDRWRWRVFVAAYERTRAAPAAGEPLAVEGAGVHPARAGALPPQLAALNRNYLSVTDLVVRAAVEENPHHIRHAAMVDPATAATLTVDEIWSLCNDMVRAHAVRLPPA